MSDLTPRIVIVGGGFGGRGTIKALRKCRMQVIPVDRTNQVAISVLSPGNIGFRSALSHANKTMRS
jgi:NADH dehydrogenase FAD-containing subunit